MFKKALEDLSHVIPEKENDPNVYYIQSIALNYLEKSKDALDSINTAIELATNEVKYLILKTIILRTMQRLDEMDNTFDKIKNIDYMTYHMLMSDDVDSIKNDLKSEPEKQSFRKSKMILDEFSMDIRTQEKQG